MKTSTTSKATTLHVSADAHPDFKMAVHLAALLQRVEGNPQAIGAAQYQQLVLQLRQLLQRLPADDNLQQLLDCLPAAATVYENNCYGHAGLCRSGLEQAVNSELAARTAIDKARGRA